MTASAESEQILLAGELDATLGQRVDVMNLQRPVGPAAAFTAPSCSIQDRCAKALPRPAPPPPMQVAVRAADDRRMRAADRSAHAQRPSHLLDTYTRPRQIRCLSEGGDRTPWRSSAEHVAGRREENPSRGFHEIGHNSGMRREHIVRVRLDDAELAVLDAAAMGAGLSRPRMLRRLILNGPGDDTSTPVTREEALELLAMQARDGSAVAAAALARELRLAPIEEVQPPVKTGPVTLDEVRRELRLRVVR
jgi:hypothetical protein